MSTDLTSSIRTLTREVERLDQVLERRQAARVKAHQPRLPERYFTKGIVTDQYAPGSLVLRGYAATLGGLRNGELHTPAALRAAAPQLKGKRLLLDHDGNKEVGRVVDARATPRGLWVEAVIPSLLDSAITEARINVSRKGWRAFSLGCDATSNAAGVIKHLEPAELSLVAQGTDPGARFEVVL